MRKALIPTAVAVAVSALIAGSAQASSPYPKADPRPGFDHSRRLEIPTRPCDTPTDYDWCFWDASRAQHVRMIDPNTGQEVIVADANGDQSHAYNETYWAYTYPGPNDGVQYVCKTYLRPRLNKNFGGCALQSTPS